MDYEGNNFQERSFGQQGRGGGSFRNNDFEGSDKSVIRIPGTHIGKIIGPAGRNINETQRKYNVRIQISKMANNDGSKDTEIFGRLCDIEDAIKDINEQINTPFVPRPPRQGGSFGGGSRFNQGGPRSFNGQQGDYGK
jgi:hypothetical protein